MRNLFLIACCFTCTLSYSQQKAITQNGDEVVLYNDGTWKYINTPSKTSETIDTNRAKFSTPAESSFLVKSKKTSYGIYINPQKWIFEKGDENSTAEYKFTLRNKNCYAMLITEEIELPFEALKAAAFENAKEAAPDAEIVKQEYRNVNGKNVLFLQMKGTITGIKFIYYGYYYSSSKGTVQILTYTFDGLFEQNKSELEKLLNGFVITH